MDNQHILQDKSAWRIEEGIILDWLDDPLEGFLMMEGGQAYFYFKMLAHLVNEERVVSRLYMLRNILQEDYIRISGALASLGVRTKPMWIACWMFESVDQQYHAETLIDQVIQASQPTNIVLQGRDISSIDYYWNITYVIDSPSKQC